MPTRRAPAPVESFVDMSFPKCGIDMSRGFSQQIPRQLADGQYGQTSVMGVNVRTYEPMTNRARGGQRSGLSKYIPLQGSGDDDFVQELACLVGVGYAPPGGSMQTSSSGRVVSLVAVAGGNVYVASPGGTAWVTATNMTGNTTPLNTSGIVLSTQLNQKLWFADGDNYCYYDPSLNQVLPWVATAGTLPVDEDENTPRLIEAWRGRMVVSGLEKDSQNWFMSRVSDPTDWQTNPTEPDPAQAVFGNNSPLGKIGDVATCLIAYSDDVLFMGCDSSIYQFSGDPMAGGQIDLVSDAIGMAWGKPFCKGPDGTIYFFSNRTGVYAMRPGQGPPQRISQQIEQLLQEVDTGANTIRMIWDDRFQGLHIFVTLTGTQDETTHFFWEQRAGAWWTDEFANTDHNPLCCCVFDGNDPGDRVPLIGSWDGYVRAIDPTAEDDDGVAIESSVVIGPLTTKDLDSLLFKDCQAVLGETSGDVSYEVFVGATAEKALTTASVASGTWGKGRNLSNLIRRSGHAIYVKITASNPWAMEAIRVRIAGKGKVARRGR